MKANYGGMTAYLSNLPIFSPSYNYCKYFVTLSFGEFLKKAFTHDYISTVMDYMIHEKINRKILI